MNSRRPSCFGFFPLWRWIDWRGQTRGSHVLWLGVGTAVFAMAVGAAAQDSQRGAVEHFIGTIVRQTATACPLTSPADQPALDRCRASLYGNSAFRRGLAPVVLWGRPSPDGRRLRDTLEGTFKELAGELRKGTCNECHAPDNAVGMKRLVLMQTPVHAAGEIKRIMRGARS